MFSKVLFPLALAFGWHSVDAFLSLTRSPRRARITWAGVGVGWSLFWMIKHLTEPQVMSTSHEYGYQVIFPPFED